MTKLSFTNGDASEEEVGVWCCCRVRLIRRKENGLPASREVDWWKKGKGALVGEKKSQGGKA